MIIEIRLRESEHRKSKLRSEKMKADIYTKFVLTVIASALVWNIVEDVPRPAHAKDGRLIHRGPIDFESPIDKSRRQREIKQARGDDYKIFKKKVWRVVRNCRVEDHSRIHC